LDAWLNDDDRPDDKSRQAMEFALFGRPRNNDIYAELRITFRKKALRERRAHRSSAKVADPLSGIGKGVARLIDRQVRLSPRIGEVLQYHEIEEAIPADRLRCVGGMITWRRLLAGLYMPRQHALSSVLAALADWRNTIESTLEDGKAPVFWIDGLSGTANRCCCCKLRTSFSARLLTA
jgi:hypothetical protein